MVDAFEVFLERQNTRGAGGPREKMGDREGRQGMGDDLNRQNESKPEQKMSHAIRRLAARYTMSKRYERQKETNEQKGLAKPLQQRY